MGDQDKKASDETPSTDGADAAPNETESEATNCPEAETSASSDESEQAEITEESTEEDLQATEVMLLKEQLENLTTKLQDYEEQLGDVQRDLNYAKAETQTVLRRGREETTRSVNRVKRELMTRLMSIADTFHQTSMELAKLEKDERIELVVSAIEMAVKEFDSVVAGEGLARSEPTGEVFDPQYHEAAAMVPSDEHEPGTIIEVLRAGYTLNDNVLRPPQVVVAQAQASKETSEEKAADDE